MQISEVRVKLMGDTQDRLLAFCSLTFDAAFVVRDLKIIKGLKGPFVAMPSRKLTDRCTKCGNKNSLRSNFCNQCGVRLRDDRAVRGQDGRAKLYADIAHPINSECREQIQTEVIHAYEREIVLARQPGYVCRYDEFDDGMMDEFQEWASDELPGHAASSEPESANPSGVRSDEPQRRIDSPRTGAAPGPHDVRSNRPAPVANEDFGEGVL